jgi:hypothetical protein
MASPARSNWTPKVDDKLSISSEQFRSYLALVDQDAPYIGTQLKDCASRQVLVDIIGLLVVQHDLEIDPLPELKTILRKFARLSLSSLSKGVTDWEQHGDFVTTTVQYAGRILMGHVPVKGVDGQVNWDKS